MTAKGEAVHAWRIGNRTLSATLLDYGARLADLRLVDSAPPARLTLGYDDFTSYLTDRSAMGATVGRYGNRIAGARFAIEGREYQLTPNDGRNHIHGGRRGLGSVAWTVAEADERAVEFVYDSVDGEEGYPGNLRLSVRFAIQDPAVLAVEYRATTDRPTHLNPTQHAYFNLAQPGAPTILDHTIQIFADRFLPVDDELIPLGPPVAVDDTPFDLRSATVIGDRVRFDHEQLRRGHGFDHTFVFGKPPGAFELAAVVTHEATGLQMRVVTTEPGVQFYTGNHLPVPHAGLCLETHHFPDSPNRPEFPSTLLTPDAAFFSKTAFEFERRC